MAQFVMKDFVEKAGLESHFHIESTATSAAEIGDLVYLPVRHKMFEYGLNCTGKPVRQLRNEDCDQYDLLMGMDRASLRNMHHLYGCDYDGKLYQLMEFTTRPGDVADPWYTNDFEAVWQNVLEDCEGLLRTQRVS